MTPRSPFDSTAGSPISARNAGRSDRLIVDGTGRLAIPGLINAHTHSAMTLLRGYSDDVPLQTWLTHVRAFELRLTAADILAGLRLALAEMLRSGTVGFVDMFQWDSALLGAVSDSGLRVSAAPAVFDYDAIAFPTADGTPGRGILDRTADAGRRIRREIH